MFILLFPFLFETHPFKQLSEIEVVLGILSAKKFDKNDLSCWSKILQLLAVAPSKRNFIGSPYLYVSDLTSRVLCRLIENLISVESEEKGVFADVLNKNLVRCVFTCFRYIVVTELAYICVFRKNLKSFRGFTPCALDLFKNS